MAADDVAKAVGRIAVGAPLNGTVEVAGPQQFRFDELIRQGLAARNDPREVVADPHARYFGAELGERSLIPADDARLGEIRLEEWLNQSDQWLRLPPVGDRRERPSVRGGVDCTPEARASGLRVAGRCSLRPSPRSRYECARNT